MYIIDKNRDYYDHLRKTYGVDKGIVYDRRGSTVLSDITLFIHIAPVYFQKRDSIEHFILEVGLVQYLFRVKIAYELNYPTEVSMPVKGEFQAIKAFNDNKHYFKKEISIVPAYVRRHWSWRKNSKEEYPIPDRYTDIKVDVDKVLGNPILRDTSIPSFISPLSMWVKLTDYISSKRNDRVVEIKNTDVEKAVNHGFDKKTSFRHPVK